MKLYELADLVDNSTFEVCIWDSASGDIVPVESSHIEVESMNRRALIDVQKVLASPDDE